MEGLEAGPLKDSIIEQMKNIETRYEEMFKCNNDNRLWDYYAKSFESLKKDFPELEGMIQVAFRNFSKELMRFLLYRYLRKTKKSLSKLCSDFPHLKDPLNVLENEILKKGFFPSYFEDMYKSQLTTLIIYLEGNRETWKQIILSLFQRPKKLC